MFRKRKLSIPVALPLSLRNFLDKAPAVPGAVPVSVSAPVPMPLPTAQPAASIAPVYPNPVSEIFPQPAPVIASRIPSAGPSHRLIP